MPEGKEQATIQTVDSLFDNYSGPPILDPKTGKFNLDRLRTNATLRHEEWKQLDDEVLDVARAKLVGIGDLQAAGLSFNLGGLGVTETRYETLSDMSSATADMDAETEPEKDRPAFATVSLPVPIIHKSFTINLRQLEASRTRGAALDVVAANIAAKKVAEKAEDMLFNGDTSININATSISGYTTHASREQVSGSDWGTASNIFTNIQSAVQALEAIYFPGPYVLYVATTQYGQMRAFYSDYIGTTNLQVALNVFPVDKVIRADSLTDEAILVQLDRSVVDLAVGQDVTTVEWNTKGGMAMHFKVMMAMVPRLKADANGSMGVAHISSI